MESTIINLDGEIVTIINIDVNINNASIFYIDSSGIFREKVKTIENRYLVIGKVQ